MPADTRQLRSQRLRQVNFQGDALRLGMNWTEEDLAKPQVLVDSAHGMGHPGTFHFRTLIEEVSNGVFEAGGKPGVFTVSDICDGVAQAHSGMSYSLVSRDIMAAMIEIHALGHPHDGMVLISGNDKSVPAHLLAIARCNLPAIHLPGGSQLNGPDYVTSDQMWGLGAAVQRGELAREELERAQSVACPTCGACQFMGSASTGQVFADPALSHTTAVVTDGRFSGAAKGPAVGHVTPEALDGGPIALIEDGDLIEIHVPDRRLALVGVHGQRLTTDQVAQVLAERLTRWVAPPPRHTSGILSLYSRVARGADSGASLT